MLSNLGGLQNLQGRLSEAMVSEGCQARESGWQHLACGWMGEGGDFEGAANLCVGVGMLSAKWKKKKHLRWGD